MLSKLLSKGPLLAALPFMSSSENPYDSIESHDKNKVFQTEDDTGVQRLKKMFQRHGEDPWHPDTIAIIQNAGAGLIGGGIYGAISKSRYTFIDFIEKNEATQFRNHYEAKRMLSDKMILSFMKGFTHWGLKVGFFVTTFTSAYTFLSVYRNKRSFWHYTVAGTLAGAIYKFPLGPKGMISGGFFGAFFGSAFGVMKLSMFKLAQLTEDEMVQHRKELKVARDEWILKRMREDQMKKVQEDFQKTMMPPEEET